MRILLVFLIVYLFYVVQARFYLKNCFKNVEIELKFELPGIFQGEKTDLIEVFYNRKLMPLWWIGSKFAASRYLVFEEEKNENMGNDNYRKDLFFMMSYEKVTKKFTITGGKRGYYRIDELELSSSDLFGEYRALRNYTTSAGIYVYPRLIDSGEINIQFRRLNGEILTKRHILEDPFQLRGIRDYHPFDSLKMVNWNATAKTGELKVNQYDYTASQEVIIFLNVERYNAWDPEKIVEECISLASSLATEYLRNGIKVELVSNGSDCISGERVKVSAGSGMSHNIEIYERLSKLDINKVCEPISVILSEEAAKMRKDAVYLLIAHYHGNNLVQAVNDARGSGMDIKWILPKDRSTKLNFELDSDLFVWEVEDL